MWRRDCIEVEDTGRPSGGHHSVQSRTDNKDAQRGGPADYNPLLFHSSTARPGSVYSLLIRRSSTTAGISSFSDGFPPFDHFAFKTNHGTNKSQQLYIRTEQSRGA